MISSYDLSGNKYIIEKHFSGVFFSVQEEKEAGVTC